jgi:hypothetical protein
MLAPVKRRQDESNFGLPFQAPTMAKFIYERINPTHKAELDNSLKRTPATSHT